MPICKDGGCDTAPAVVPAQAMEPLRGEYGFFTEFDGISEEEARARVRFMVRTYQVREFQFYDAFRGYSEPPGADEEHWHSALFSRPIRRDLLVAYADEIRRNGGRSWFYVQAVGTAPGDSELQRGFKKVGSHMVMGKPLLDIVQPTSDWARRIVPRWADFVASLGFSGVHWDTLGNYHGSLGPGSSLAGFLETALPLVRARGLEQTANFVDGKGWEPRLWRGPGEASNAIAFPYWEVWSVPRVEEEFFEKVVPKGGGVFVCYPGKTPGHQHEGENRLAEGIWPFDLLIKRWKKARCSGNTYLAIGDGNKHIQTEYFPDTANISDADTEKLEKAVFRGLHCPSGSLGKPIGTAGTSSSSTATAASTTTLKTVAGPTTTGAGAANSTTGGSGPAANATTARPTALPPTTSTPPATSTSSTARPVVTVPVTAPPRPTSTETPTTSTETTTEPEPCFEWNSAYDPLDARPGPLLHFSTALDCQKQCARTEDCHHFSYYPDLGHCHLEDAFATRAIGRLGFISGPVVCPGQEALPPTAHRLSYHELGCLDPGVEYVPMLGEAQLFGPEYPQRVAILECQKRCASTAGCLHFTVTKNGPGAGLSCALAGTGATRLGPFLQKLSGPRACLRENSILQSYLADHPATTPDPASTTRSALVALASAALLTFVALHALRVWLPQQWRRSGGHRILQRGPDSSWSRLAHCP